jgi:adenosine receptor A2a
VGFLPLFGWHRSQPTEGMKCLFTEVMDYDYLLFLYFATIVAPALLLAAFYAHIYRVVLNQVQYIYSSLSFVLSVLFCSISLGRRRWSSA